MSKHTRTWLLLALGIALTAMLLLAASASELQFLPGESAPGSGEVVDDEATGGMSPELDEAFRTAFRIFAAIIVVGLPLVILYSLFSPEARRNLLKGMVPILLFALFLYLAFRVGSKVEEQLTPTPMVAPVATQITPVPEQTVEAIAEELGGIDRSAPEWLIWGAVVSLALIMALALVGLGRLLLRYRERQPSPLAELADQAEDAVEAIRAGADLRDTVQLCYYRMSQTLQQQRGIRREIAMTPREFEAYLGRSGIPVEHVRRLTRLFEQVRYGAKATGKEDEHQALLSLGAIVEYCRSVQ